jgi:hypothetical protein
VGVEFIDEPLAPAGDDLPTGPDGPSRRRVLQISGLVVLAVIVLIALRHGETTTSRPPSTPSSAAPSPVHTPGLGTKAGSLIALAEHTAPLSDVVRGGGTRGACALVAPGSSPQTAVVRAIARTLGPIRSAGTSRTIDQFAGLCELQVRVVEAHYTVVAIVTSPTSAAARRANEFVEVTNTSLGERTLAYVEVIDVQGWHVLIGTLGRQRASDQDLLSLAHASALRW